MFFKQILVTWIILAAVLISGCTANDTDGDGYEKTVATENRPVAPDKIPAPMQVDENAMQQEVMTMDAVIALGEKGSDLRPEDFIRFSGGIKNENEWNLNRITTYPLLYNGKEYELVISEMAGALDYAHLKRVDTGEFVDIRLNSTVDFLDTVQNLEDILHISLPEGVTQESFTQHIGTDGGHRLWYSGAIIGQIAAYYDTDFMDIDGVSYTNLSWNHTDPITAPMELNNESLSANIQRILFSSRSASDNSPVGLEFWVAYFSRAHSPWVYVLAMRSDIVSEDEMIRTVDNTMFSEAAFVRERRQYAFPR